MQFHGREINLLPNHTRVNLASNNLSTRFSNQPCPDQIVGDISVQNGVATLINSIILNRTTVNRNIDFDYNNIPQCNYIVLILESPHTDEFDNFQNPLGPACGSTGNNINRYINNVLTNSPNFVATLQNGIYRLLIMNAVQYQASLGITPLNRNIRDANWINLWTNHFQCELADRINRIRRCSADYKIVNLCTFGNAGLHFYINRALMANNIPFNEGYHPSNWSIRARRTII